MKKYIKHSKEKFSLYLFIIFKEFFMNMVENNKSKFINKAVDVWMVGFLVTDLI